MGFQLASELRRRREVNLPTLLEVSDAARMLELSASGVRAAVESGRLLPVALTPRGNRLFSEDDVVAFRAKRAAQRSQAGGDGEVPKP
jgi:hypothetical protein